MINTKQNLLFIATILALCVISFVHLFLFPLYDVTPRRENFKTFFDFEQSLCLTNLPPGYQHQQNAKGSCPPTPAPTIVTAVQGGRLGNQMWEYASVWGVARRTGLEPYIPRCILFSLKAVFQSLSIEGYREIGHCLVDVSSFVYSLESWMYTNQSILLKKYHVLPDIVLNWVNDIREEFTFKKKLRQKSQAILRRSRNDSRKAMINETQIVYVGVHVRRTDYLRYLWNKHGAYPAEPKFFLDAMKYFESKFRNCVFVFVSDDTKWCSENFSGKPNVFIAGPNPPGVDLALLASCNHSIFDYGTFGTWGAILAGGETVYYNLTKHSSKRVGQLLPNWLPMS